MSVGAIFESMASPFVGAASGAGKGSPNAARPSYPKLTLEQYVSFCVEMELKPAERARIFADYGIGNPTEHVALSVAWGAELEAKPAERQRFDELRKRYTEWVRSQQR